MRLLLPRPVPRIPSIALQHLVVLQLAYCWSLGANLVGYRKHCVMTYQRASSRPMRWESFVVLNLSPVESPGPLMVVLCCIYDLTILHLELPRDELSRPVTAISCARDYSRYYAWDVVASISWRTLIGYL